MKKIVTLLFLAVQLNAFGQFFQMDLKSLGPFENSELLIARRQGGDKFYAVDTINRSKMRCTLEPGLYSFITQGNIIGDFLIYDSPIQLGFKDSTLEFSDENNQAFIGNNKIWMEKIASGNLDSIPMIFRVAFPQMTRLDSSDLSTSKIHLKYWNYPQTNWKFVWNSPFWNEMVDYYFQKMQFNSADSITKSVDKLLRIVPAEYRRNFEYKILSLYENHKVVGFENVFVHVGTKYLANESDLDTTDYKIIGKANSLSVNMVGKMANDFTIKTVNGTDLNLYRTDGLYKILFFFDPDCHHCQEAWPDFVAFCKANRDKGFKGYAISLSEDLDQLNDFIEDYGRADNIEFGYPAEGSRDSFRGKYYIPSTPAIYILSSGNKVLARNLSVNDLDPFMRVIGF
jgi:thiol-disulfide isomerase/thioredoxin